MPCSSSGSACCSFTALERMDPQKCQLSYVIPHELCNMRSFSCDGRLRQRDIDRVAKQVCRCIDNVRSKEEKYVLVRAVSERYLLLFAQLIGACNNFLRANNGCLAASHPAGK